MKCKYCGCEMEAEFVDIGIGEQQVSDWQCPNDNCPEYLDWLEKNRETDVKAGRR
ncbi:hypothetical protein LCM23_25540 [Cytobacillus kochii]|uniref:hypothetical protein n=1 Tax=Cytobacillus kochii TaxID=859143 RepID=UPI001CD48E0C|nr:hypothetical protein [Cytobacillus kochii]MCA1029379.1 hypothetical protein [Cytobacillus kochii]